MRIVLYVEYLENAGYHDLIKQCNFPEISTLIKICQAKSHNPISIVANKNFDPH